MRLLVISSYWPRPHEPIKPLFVADQIAALCDLGYEVDVLIMTEIWRLGQPFETPATLGLDPDRVRIEQITMPRLPEKLARLTPGFLANIQIIGLLLRMWISRYLRSHGQPDGVIVHGERGLALSAPIWATSIHAPKLLIVHGADPMLETLHLDFATRHVGKPVSATFRRIVLVGNRLRSYAEALGYDSGRLQVIANGFRPPADRPEPKTYEDRQGPVQLISVARLVELKGIDDTLAALARLRQDHPDHDWHYRIVGDGPDRARLEEIVRQLKLSDAVTFEGPRPHAKVMALLAESDVFVLPSWNEAFGLAYLEAMIMGNAVIGCLGNGAEDILQQDVEGILIPPRDVAALTAAVEQLIANPKTRQRLGRAAMLGVERFTWTKNAAQILGALGLD